MNTSSGTQRICSTSPGVRKVFLPMTMPERRLPLVPAASCSKNLMLAVAGQVQDAPGILVQSGKDCVSSFVDAVHGRGNHSRRAGRRPFAPPARAPGRSGNKSQPSRSGLPTTRPWPRGMRRVGTEVWGLELAHQPGSNCGRTAAVAPAVLQQLPRVAGRDLVHQHHQIHLLGRQLLQAVGQQHFKQRLGRLQRWRRRNARLGG